MGIASGLIVFVMVWWIVFYMCLPFGVQKSTTIEPGHDRGAPHKPFMAYKITAATLITSVIWVIIYFLIKNIN